MGRFVPSFVRRILDFLDEKSVSHYSLLISARFSHSLKKGSSALVQFGWKLFTNIVSVTFIVLRACFFTNSVSFKNGTFATILLGCAFKIVHFPLILWTLLRLICFRTCMLSHINCLTVCLQFSKSNSVCHGKVNCLSWIKISDPAFLSLAYHVPLPYRH